MRRFVLPWLLLGCLGLTAGLGVGLGLALGPTKASTLALGPTKASTPSPTPITTPLPVVPTMPPPPAGPTTTTTTLPDAVDGGGAPNCSSSSLSWSFTDVSPPTGHDPIGIVLANDGPSACVLNGFPTVTLEGVNGAPLPFVYSHAGDMVVTTAAPMPVLLSPEHVGYVVIDKYRCDSGDQASASELVMALPGTGSLVIALPEYPDIGYCGTGDFGSIVAVSPVEPTLRLTRRI